MLYISVGSVDEAISAAKAVKVRSFVLPSNAGIGWSAISVEKDEEHVSLLLSRMLPNLVLLLDIRTSGWSFCLHRNSTLISAYSCDWSHCTLDQLDKGSGHVIIDDRNLNLPGLESFIAFTDPQHGWYQPSAGMASFTSVHPFEGSREQNKLRYALSLPNGCEDLYDVQPYGDFAMALGLTLAEDFDFSSVMDTYTSSPVEFKILFPEIIYVDAT